MSLHNAYIDHKCRSCGKRLPCLIEDGRCDNLGAECSSCSMLRWERKMEQADSDDHRAVFGELMDLDDI